MCYNKTIFNKSKVEHKNVFENFHKKKQKNIGPVYFDPIQFAFGLV